MRVTVLFDNFGPYHIARLTAAAEICELSAIEVKAASREYQWQMERGPTPFLRRTLFDSQANETSSVPRLATILSEVIKETRPDVVAIPGWSSWNAFAALHWCVRNRVPAIVMSESTCDDERRTTWKEWIKQRYVRMCSAALVGGHRNRDYLVQLGMPEDKIFFGYDVVDNEYFAQRARQIRKEAARCRTQLRLPERYFLASARFIPKKNLNVLLHAYAIYRKECNDRESIWDLVVLGDGAERANLESFRQELGLVSSVHFPGFKQYDELPPYYALAGAFIHPSSVEPWGLVVNEAMAASLPVLVSNRCGCAQTLVREGENGRTFDPHEPEAIAARMLAMSQASDEARAAMGRSSAEIIAEFDPERFADGLRRAAIAAMERQANSPRASDMVLLHSLIIKSLLSLRAAPAANYPQTA